MPDERAILHSDMNSFYASVEMMLDPSLKGKAVAVCGSTENRHGIVLAKSELARLTPVEEVHHIPPISKGGTHSQDNLMSVCRSCHNKIHIERGER